MKALPPALEGTPQYSLHYELSSSSPKLKWKDWATLITALIAFALSLYNFFFETFRGADLRGATPNSVGLFFESCNKYNDKHYVRATVHSLFINLGGPKSVAFLKPLTATLAFQDESLEFKFQFAARTERHFGSETHCTRLSDGSTVYNRETKYVAMSRRETASILVLEPNKIVAPELFFYPDGLKYVRSNEEIAKKLTIPSTFKLTFHFTQSENWIGWEKKPTPISVTCEVTVDKEITDVFSERAYFTVDKPKSKCTWEGLKLLADS